MSAIGDLQLVVSCCAYYNNIFYYFVNKQVKVSNISKENQKTPLVVCQLPGFLEHSHFGWTEEIKLPIKGKRLERRTFDWLQTKTIVKSRFNEHYPKIKPFCSCEKIHTHMHSHTHIHTHTHTYARAERERRAQARKHAHTHARTHAHTHSNTHFLSFFLLPNHIHTNNNTTGCNF